MCNHVMLRGIFVCNLCEILLYSCNVNVATIANLSALVAAIVYVAAIAYVAAM